MYYKLDKSKKQKINDNNGSLITIYKFYTAYCISNCNKYYQIYTSGQHDRRQTEKNLKTWNFEIVLGSILF